ncbi:Asp23/Gls24 family envelope stress response protein [Microbacterium sp.]|uniref:Asp23/Gls24 family envelope stress response protein n=1 Tax=Microbacterium sp. TaxID=51671 RepID=UPI0025D6E252|nr:Asp23/Gls24 family envelope stress response protein [Microbacterium sp.]MBT9606713.1 Asp23/Gls24 family envelope stress response protein [Microbacterium sp.]
MAIEDTPTASPAAPHGSRVDRAVTGSEHAAETAGKNTIADAVVAKIAGMAAREVAGVHALGGGGARAFGAIRDAMNATDLAQGVKVEVGETQAAADLTIVVEYPAPLQEVADQVRARVAGAISRLVGLEVVEVNVDVNDIHIPGDDDDDSTPSRVS